MAFFFFALAKLSYAGLYIYEWMLILSLVLTWFSPDPSHPLVRLLYRSTRPLWQAIERVCPVMLKPFSAYLSLILVWFLQIFLPNSLTTLAYFFGGDLPFRSIFPQILGNAFLGLGVVLGYFLWFLILVFVVWFVLTLVKASPQNTLVQTIYYLVDPFIHPLQHYLPRQKIDLSPLVAAGILLAVKLTLVEQLVLYGAWLSHYVPAAFSG